MKITEKNGYKISALTLGTAQLGLAYGVNNSRGMPSYEESAELLTEALSLGIVSFDTARAYGTSEAVLGRYFRENKCEKTLITKALFKEETVAEVRDSLLWQTEDSIKTLGVDKLPFLKLHNDSYIKTYGETLLLALSELKERGLVANVGMSFSDKTHLAEYASSGAFDCIQLPANMFDNYEIRTGIIKKLSDMGVTVFVRSVYLQGLFFKNTDELPEKIRSAKRPLDRLHALARDNGISMAEMAFCFMRDTEGIDSLVLGADTPAQLRESASLASAATLPRSLLDKILEISEEIEPVTVRPWEWFK